jgi:hypothetical protein
MSAPNPSRGEVGITLNGVDYALRPTFDVVKRIEKRAGRNLLAILRDLSTAATIGVVPFADVVEGLNAALDAGPDAKGLPPHADRDEWYMEAGLSYAQAVFVDLIISALGADRSPLGKAPSP